MTVRESAIAAAAHAALFERAARVTPGGVHSERDIPRALDDVRRAHPGVPIDYRWPFDLASVAELLASHITQALAGTP